MRRVLPLFCALGLAALVGACDGGADAPPAPAPESSEAAPVIEPSEPFGDVVSLDWRGPADERETLWAWVADTPEKRALGLMHRTELPENAGMVFVFAQEHSGGFWMRNTRIPLSIAYLSPEAEVLAVLDMEPCTADPCPVYDPGVPYHYAVETNLGWFAERAIDAGWRLTGELPKASA